MQESTTVDASFALDRELLETMDKDETTHTDENIDKLVQPVNSRCVEDMENQEKAIIKLANIRCKKLQDKELIVLFPVLREFINCPNKSRTARLLRVVLDIFLESNVDRNECIKLCTECVEWAKKDKKTFLCQIFEIKLASFYYEIGRMNDAIFLGERLVDDLKKMSYKDELIEILNVMCRVYFVLGNFQKCRAFLTSVKTTANTTHLSTKLQAQIDLLSGSIHCKENDYLTAYSYFYEAFEVAFIMIKLFDSIESRFAVKALKYMLFSKIMVGKPQEVPSVLSGKLSLKYRNRELDSMKAVAEVFKNKNLNQMKSCLAEFEDELVHDSVVKVHLEHLHEKLFEDNLLLVIQPYSTVEISYIAQLVKMNKTDVINRIARMILDGKLHATIDQGVGTLEVFQYKENDGLYKECKTSLSSLSKLVETLRNRKPIEVKN